MPIPSDHPGLGNLFGDIPHSSRVFRLNGREITEIIAYTWENGEGKLIWYTGPQEPFIHQNFPNPTGDPNSTLEAVRLARRGVKREYLRITPTQPMV